MKSTLRKLKNKLFRRNSPPTTRTKIAESYQLISQLGFFPKTIIDVGVASGTEELYSAFPNAELLLIEALPQFEQSLISILKRYSGSYVMAAAGAKADQVTFNCHPTHLEGSSLYKESMGSEADGYEVTVPMVKLDDVIHSKKLNSPYLIKVDVQGAELDVLEGAQKTLLDTEVVVLEVSMFEFMVGAPQFADVIIYMKNLGFVPYDIILGWNRPLDNALGQVDIVFVTNKGMFRKNHGYSTGHLD